MCVNYESVINFTIYMSIYEWFRQFKIIVADSINIVSNAEAILPIHGVDEEKRHRDMLNSHMFKSLEDGKINKIMKQVDYV